MKRSHLIMLAGCAMLIGFSGIKPHFTEKNIDNNGPQDLWMKTIGDVNQDGKTDMLVGGWNSGGLVAYLAPDWKKKVICDTLKISTDGEVCDVDNDGVADIVAITDRALVWIKAPTWTINIIDSLNLHDIETGDFDNDGSIDVIGRNQAEWGQGDTLFIYHRDPAGKWIKTKKIIVNGEGLKAADVNGDGMADIIINGYWLENTGKIDDWREHKFSDSWNWRNTFIDVADFNRDGRADILLSPSELAGHYYHVSWFEAPEDPSINWKEHIAVDSIETVIHFIGAADFNLDGRMDFMLAHMQQGTDPDEVAVYYQKRRNRWEKEVISNGGCHSMRLFDFDNDGDIDAFGGNWREHVVKMWINNTR
jgi:hypothetical protein